MSRRHALRCGLLCACLGAYADNAAAQLPAGFTSPLNTVGRALGIGYSDGYHECPAPTSQHAPAALYAAPAVVMPSAVVPPPERVRAELYEQASEIAPRPRRSLPAMMPVSSSSELYASPDVHEGREISGAIREDVGATLLPAGQSVSPDGRVPPQPQQPPLPPVSSVHPSMPRVGAEADGVANQNPHAKRPIDAGSRLAPPGPAAQPEDAGSLIDLEPSQQPNEIVDFQSRMSTESSSRRVESGDARSLDRGMGPLPRQEVGLREPPQIPLGVDLPSLDAGAGEAALEASPSDADGSGDQAGESLLLDDVEHDAAPATAPKAPAVDRQPVEPSRSELPAVDDADLLLPSSAGPAGLNPRQMPQTWHRLPGPPRTAGSPLNRYRQR